MTDIATLAFGRSEHPEEQGMIVLSDEGTVRLEPSPALRDALAEKETEGLVIADRYGTHLGAGLLIAGMAAMVGGWLAGRYFGKSASRLLWAQPVSTVFLERDADGTLAIDMNGNKWTGGPCDETDYQRFLQHTKEMYSA